MNRLLFLCMFFVATHAVAQETSPLADAATTLSAEEQEIHQFFAGYQTATGAESVKEQSQFFDYEALTQDVIDQSGVSIPPGVQPQFAAAMQAQIEKQFEILDAPWTRHRIVQTEFSDDKAIADVFVRSWSDELGTARELYLLKKIDGQWKICDISELSMGISMVTMAAMGLRDTMQSNIVSELAHGMKELLQSILECTQGNVYSATDHIEAVVGYPIPESMQSLRWIISAVTHADTEPTRTIEALEKADSFGQSTMLADYLKGEAYSQLGRYEVAIKHFRAYLDQFGADADAYHSLGFALEQLNRADEAIDAYKAALADTPESIDNLSALALALPESRKEEFLAFYRAIADPTSSFEQLGDGFVYALDASGLQTIIDATAAMDPEAEYLDYYRAMLEHLRGNHVAAYDALAKSLANMDADSEARTWYEYALCDVARRCERMNEAYAICENKAQAIEKLVDRTDINGDVLPEAVSNEAVDELLSKYLQENENDFEALMLVGRSHLGREQYETARDCFVKAMEAANDDADQRREALEECVYCYVDMGRALDAYRDLEPKAEVVESLEYAIDDQKLINEIVERLRVDEPESPRFLWDDLISLLDSRDCQKGLDRVDRALDVIDRSEDDYQWKFLQQYRTRFLIGLERYDDAILAAHAAGEGYRHFLRALVYAAKGDRRKFLAAYEQCLSSDEMHDEESFASAPEIPDGWLPDSPPQNDNEPFSPYTQVRRVILLLDEPCSVNANRVIEASREMDEPLYAIDRRQMTAEEDDYVFEATDHSVIVATHDCRYFIHCGNEPYLYNADLLAGELLEGELASDEEIGKLIRQHSAWIAIDIFQWPQVLDKKEARAIPGYGATRLAQFARQLTGDRATVAIHADMQMVTKCSEDFFVKLSSDEPISAFEGSAE